MTGSKASWRRRTVTAIAGCIVTLAAASSAPAQEQGTTALSTGTADASSKQGQAQKDALFVYYLLISCAGAGTIISYLVWRSMPPRKKQPEDAKESG